MRFGYKIVRLYHIKRGKTVMMRTFDTMHSVILFTYPGFARLVCTKRMKNHLAFTWNVCSVMSLKISEATSKYLWKQSKNVDVLRILEAMCNIETPKRRINQHVMLRLLLYIYMCTLAINSTFTGISVFSRWLYKNFRAVKLLFNSSAALGGGVLIF